VYIFHASILLLTCILHGAESFLKS